MTALDFTPIVQSVMAVGIAAVAVLIQHYGPPALAAFQARTGIALTDQQRAAVLGAVSTAAGVIETDIDRGALSIAHVHVGNQSVLLQAQSAINAVPNAAAALGLTPDAVARMIVGQVDTGSRTSAAPVTAPADPVNAAIASPTEPTALFAKLLPLALSAYQTGVTHGVQTSAAVAAIPVPVANPPVAAPPAPPVAAAAVDQPAAVPAA